MLLGTRVDAPTATAATQRSLSLSFSLPLSLCLFLARKTTFHVNCLSAALDAIVVAVASSGTNYGPLRFSLGANCHEACFPQVQRTGTFL